MGGSYSYTDDSWRSNLHRSVGAIERKRDNHNDTTTNQHLHGQRERAEELINESVPTLYFPSCQYYCDPTDFLQQPTKAQWTTQPDECMHACTGFPGDAPPCTPPPIVSRSPDLALFLCLSPFPTSLFFSLATSHQLTSYQSLRRLFPPHWRLL